MFQQIRQGEQLYILHKDEYPRMELASVTFASQLKPKFQNQYNPYLSQPGQEMLIDLTVKLGEQTIDLGGLPATADVVDLTSSGKPMIVTCSREALLSQAETLYAKSKQIVDSRDYNLHQMQGLENVMQQLNPQLAERKAQDQRMEQMGREMGSVKSELGEVKSMLAKLLSQGSNRSEAPQKQQQSAPNPKNN
jgi:hypothetical protein